MSEDATDKAVRLAVDATLTIEADPVLTRNAVECAMQMSSSIGLLLATEADALSEEARFVLTHLLQMRSEPLRLGSDAMMTVSLAAGKRLA